MKKCPFCAESVQDAAIKCKYCGEMIGKVFDPANEKALVDKILALINQCKKIRDTNKANAGGMLGAVLGTVMEVTNKSNLSFEKYEIDNIRTSFTGKDSSSEKIEKEIMPLLLELMLKYPNSIAYDAIEDEMRKKVNHSFRFKKLVDEVQRKLYTEG